MRGGEAWLFPNETLDKPILKDNIWTRNFVPQLRAIGMEWANFQVIRRTFATLTKQVGVDPHTRSAQMGNTVDVNENVYAVTQPAGQAGCGPQARNSSRKRRRRGTLERLRFFETNGTARIFRGAPKSPNAA